MLKRIYSIFVVGTLMVFTPAYSTQSVSNIKKIIKKDGKIIVIIRENGKEKKLILNDKELKKITSKKDKKDKKLSKSNSKKSTKISTNDNKKSKKLSKKSSENSKKLSKSKKNKVYKVVSGDTIFSIARKYKVSISDLVKLNKLSNKRLIHPGDEIKIPSNGYLEAAKRAVATNNKTVYTVQKGDTLYSIAKKFNMKVKKLRSLNNLIKNPKLKPGMELSVIGKPKKEIKKANLNKKYLVKRGDTLWSIAKRNKLTIAQLKLLNPSLRRGLKKGMILQVSKARAIKLSKLANKRKRRLRGLLSKYKQRSSRYGRGSRSVVAYAKRFLGVRYRWGATGRGGFDCSGFTQYVMRHAKGKIIPRVSRRQAYYGRYVSRRNLRPGDLIFFDTSRRRRGYVNHVGIYIGNGKFIHASSGKHRVVITSLNKPFYRSRFMWGRRVN